MLLYQWEKKASYICKYIILPILTVILKLNLRSLTGRMNVFNHLTGNKKHSVNQTLLSMSQQFYWWNKTNSYCW